MNVTELYLYPKLNVATIYVGINPYWLEITYFWKNGDYRTFYYCQN